ncbi:unnamed protein product [Heterosigma akashiwo]
MGGGAHPHFPKYVWTPTGGWFASPANWKMNTAVAFVGIGCAMLGVFQISAAKERRPIPPANRILSQSWCKYAKEDDPDLDRKV